MGTTLARRSLFRSVGALLLAKALERLPSPQYTHVFVNGQPVRIGEGTTGGRVVRWAADVHEQRSPWVVALAEHESLVWAGAAVGYALVSAVQLAVDVSYELTGPAQRAMDVSDSSELDAVFCDR